MSTSAFPFSDEDWDRVHELGLACVNATLADDDALAASLHLQFIDLIDEMRRRYDDHPALIETLADFTPDATESHALYGEAARRAESMGIPTFTIRLSWAESLFDEGERSAALEQLRRCADEVGTLGDEDHRRAHRELLRKWPDPNV